MEDPESKYANAKEKLSLQIGGNDDTSKGIEYAEGQKDIPGFYNPFDCTNFGSQIWNSAGQEPTELWRQDSTAWIYTPAFVENWSDDDDPLLYNTDGVTLMNNTSLVKQVYSLDIPLLSAVVYDIAGTAYEWDHLAIVVGYSGNGMPMIDEHNGPYSEKFNRNQRSMLDSPNMHIIRILIIMYPGTN